MTLIFATAALAVVPALTSGVGLTHGCKASSRGPTILLCQGMGETNEQRDLEQPDMQQRDLEMGDDAVRQDQLEQGDRRQQQLEGPDQQQQDLDTPGAADQDDDGDGR